MKRKVFVFSAILLAAVAMVITSCKKENEEFYFKATVVGAELCGSVQNPNAYLLKMDIPGNIGDTITLDVLQNNVIRAFGKNIRALHDGETIYGVAYEHKNYGALNCNIVSDRKLPEYVIISVDEDPSVVNE